MTVCHFVKPNMYDTHDPYVVACMAAMAQIPAYTSGKSQVETGISKAQGFCWGLVSAIRQVLHGCQVFIFCSVTVASK